jgi:hypothetical protein
MKPSAKTDKWDGEKKAIIRALKVQAIKQAVREDRISEKPVALTLAGAKAHLEISITNQKLVSPEDIITIQSPLLPSKTVGSKVLHKLVKLRDASLPGMLIWPESFSSFCAGYKTGKTTIPAFAVNQHNPPAWYKATTFRREMHRFVDAVPRPFDIVDADLCGIFSEDNGTSIANLMYNGMLADSGLMFINHQKGRDGKCIPFLHNYFHHEGLFDLHSLQDYYDQALTLTLEGKDKWDKKAMFHAIRSTLVPIFYVLEAFKAGYRLEPVRLAEYRDRNMTTSGVGVNMFQWFFRFEKLESEKLKEANSFDKYGILLAKVRKKEREMLKYQLDILAEEAYAYNDYVD